MSILFKGDNKALISSITALLALDAKGALSPHGIGEMARQLLEACSARLAEQHQGEPVVLPSCNAKLSDSHDWDQGYRGGWRACLDEIAKLGPLYTHADPAEVEALRGAYLRAGEREHELRTELAQLRSALKFYADRDHYSTDDDSNWDSCSGEPANILWHESEPWFIEDGSIARAALEPKGPKCNACGDTGTIDDTSKDELPNGHYVERGLVACEACESPDEPTDLATWKRRAIEAESKLRTYDPQVVELGERAMQALLVDPKPSELVLTKCRLCDQLQADLTARDQRLDQLQQVMQKVATLRGTLDLHGLREEVEALVWPDLHSRPEERGTPETEPCSGCGTPGWTGACNKCVPY